MKAELEPIVEKLARHWCETFTVLEDPRGGLAVSSSFVMADGDAVPVHIDYDRSLGRWVLSDLGRILTLLDFDDAFTVTDRTLVRIELMAEAWGAGFSDGTLFTELTAPPDAFDVADFLQLLGAVNGLTLARDVEPRSNFRTIVRGLVERWLPEEVDRSAGWYDRKLDPRGVWSVDLRIWRPGAVPLDSFFVANREPMEHAIATLLHHHNRGIEADRLVVHRRIENSPLMYRLQDAAMDTGARLVPVRGDDLRRQTATLSLRRALRSADVPLRPDID